MASSRIIRGPVTAFQKSRLPELGKIKVGMVVDGHPASTDYFVATGKYAPVFDRVYGEKPTRLEIAFASNDPADSCHEEWVVRDKGGRLLSSGDGQVWRSWSMKEERYIDDDRATVEEIETRYKQPAKATLTLRFILLRIPDVLGLWSFQTRGDKTSIPAIRGVFDHMIQAYGRVTNVSFDLVVKKVKSQSPGSKSAFPIVELVPNMSAESLEALAEYASHHQLRGVITTEKLKALTAQAVPETKLLTAASDAHGDK